MQVIVLGSKGMLGKYVWSYLNKFECVGVNRDSLDASTATEEKLEELFIKELKIEKGDVIINCMGTIKPRVDSLGDLNAILVNSVFPRVLANFCEKNGLKLIHPTTDCVYSGLKGSYDENDKYDVSDVYGMSKAIGEPNNCTVIRTSIIGEEVNQGRSLVEWVKSSANKTVNGFTNHFWNGITCLQFAKICEQIIRTNNFWSGIKHIHSNTLNKQELVQTISDVYSLNITVTPVETPITCDRSMSTIHTTGITVPPLKQQIEEMKEFSEILYK
jgi:dTDP-4-dehydrorhamnose reductase